VIMKIAIDTLKKVPWNKVPWKKLPWKKIIEIIKKSGVGIPVEEAVRRVIQRLTEKGAITEEEYKKLREKIINDSSSREI